MARPKLNIDAEQVEKLAMLQCTGREMAAFFGCDEKTLRNRFSANIDKGKQTGKISLRRMQWKSAEHGNVTMQIFLGKNMLEQSDRQEINNNNNETPPSLAITFKVAEPKNPVKVTIGKAK